MIKEILRKIIILSFIVTATAQSMETQTEVPTGIVANYSYRLGPGQDSKLEKLIDDLPSSLKLEAIKKLQQDESKFTNEWYKLKRAEARLKELDPEAQKGAIITLQNDNQTFLQNLQSSKENRLGMLQEFESYQVKSRLAQLKKAEEAQCEPEKPNNILFGWLWRWITWQK